MKLFYLVKPESKSGRLQRRIAFTKWFPGEPSREEFLDWVQKLESIEKDTRTYHSSHAFDRVPKGMKELGDFAGAGKSCLTIYKWEDGSIYVDVFAVDGESVDGIKNGLWTHEEPGRYEDVWFALNDEPGAMFNLGTIKNPRWELIINLVKNLVEKTA